MKSIQHLKDKIKGTRLAQESLILQVFILILVAIGSFVLGRLSLDNGKNEKVEITNPNGTNVDTSYVNKW